MFLFAKTQRCPFLRIILLAVLLGNYLFSYSQMPQWDWALQVHGNNEDPIGFFDADNFGNTLIAGALYSPAITIGDTQLVRTSEYITGDGYIAVLNNEGNLKWARKIFNSDNGHVQPVDLRSAVFDVHGNILITGWFFSGDLYIDTTILMGEENTSMGFILKFDVNGILIWSHLFEEGVDATDIVSDIKGGFYFLGRMIWYCPQMDLSDTVLVNIGAQNQAFIVHYNDAHIVDWAKLIVGYNNYIAGVTNDAGDLCFRGQLENYGGSIDSITLNNPLDNYLQNFFGVCNSSGEVLWARTLSDNNEGLNSIIFKNDLVNTFGSFYDSWIIIEEDTIFNTTGAYVTNFMSTFNNTGDYISTTLLPTDIPYSFSVSTGANNGFNLGFQISTPVWNGIDTMINISGTPDPGVLYFDSELNKIGGFSLPLFYNGPYWQFSNIPRTIYDPFGNLVFVSSFAGDTLLFGDDVLTNYQLSNQSDFYVAKSNECDNTLFDISIIGGILYAIDGIAWQWYSNDYKLNGAVFQQFNPLSTAQYRVRVTLDNGCYAWSNPIYYNREVTDNINIFIFPNPANDFVNIEISEPFDELAIYSVLGQKITSWAGANQLNITFSYHTPGLYFAVVTKGEKQSCIKLILL